MYLEPITKVLNSFFNLKFVDATVWLFGAMVVSYTTEPCFESRLI